MVGPVGEGVNEGVNVNVGGCGVKVSVKVDEGVAVGVIVHVGVTVGVLVSVGVCVAVAVRVKVAVGDKVIVGLAVMDGVKEGVHVKKAAVVGEGTSVAGARKLGTVILSVIHPAVTMATTSASRKKISEIRL